MDDQGMQIHYRKGTKVMVIQAFDGRLFCSVNDKDIYALDKIPMRERKSKEFDPDYTEPKSKKRYIPPMSHPWRRGSFQDFVRRQKHRQGDESTT